MGLRLAGISKEFRGKEILKDVSFEVGDKELFVLAGPPGAGKTTLLKIIAGLIAPDKGGVYIGKRLVNDVPPNERDVGMVFETPAVYPNITGYDNIAFPLRMKGLPGDDIASRVVETAKLLGVTHVLDRKPQTFSGGELQRVALARALIRNPRILLLDEPLKNLDAKLREKMRVELKRLQRELGITMIFSTHDQLEAVTCGDRIAVINEGSIEQLDVPTMVYDHPRNTFVARFVGSPPMNLFDCTLRKKGNRLLLDAGDFVVDITKRAEGLRELGKTELILGVRPEDISMIRTYRPNSVEGAVELTQSVGDEQVVTVRIGESRASVVIGKEAIVVRDDKVYLTIDPAKTHLFEKDTKEAIV